MLQTINKTKGFTNVTWNKNLECNRNLKYAIKFFFSQISMTLPILSLLCFPTFSCLCMYLNSYIRTRNIFVYVFCFWNCCSLWMMNSQLHWLKNTAWCFILWFFVPLSINSFEQVMPLLLYTLQTLVYCFFNLCENIQFNEILLFINWRVTEWQLILHNWIIFWIFWR